MARRDRVAFVDLVRAAAVVQMVQGHTVDAVLGEVHRAGEVYEFWRAARGLTAVAFLMAAGMAFYVTTLHDFASYRGAAGRSGRRLRRALFLIGLGYVLHAPLGLLAGNASSAAIHEFVIVDVLQCIGVSLLLMESIVVVGVRRGSRRLVVWGLVALAVATTVLTPILQPLEATGAARPLLNYLTSRGGSLFPLFPWAAHMLAGAAAAVYVFEVESVRARAARLAVVAVGSGALAFLLKGVAADAMVIDHLGRFALVVAGAALLCLVGEPLIRFSLVGRVASETLFIYVSHLIIAYGDGIGLEHLVGHSLTPAQATLVALMVLCASVWAALAVRRRAASGLGLVGAPSSG